MFSFGFHTQPHLSLPSHVSRRHAYMDAHGIGSVLQLGLGVQERGLPARRHHGLHGLKGNSEKHAEIARKGKADLVAAKHRQAENGCSTSHHFRR